MRTCDATNVRGKKGLADLQASMRTALITSPVQECRDDSCKSHYLACSGDSFSIAQHISDHVCTATWIQSALLQKEWRKALPSLPNSRPLGRGLQQSVIETRLGNGTPLVEAVSETKMAPSGRLVARDPSDTLSGGLRSLRITIRAHRNTTGINL